MRCCTIASKIRFYSSLPSPTFRSDRTSIYFKSRKRRKMEIMAAIPRCYLYIFSRSSLIATTHSHNKRKALRNVFQHIFRFTFNIQQAFVLRISSETKDEISKGFSFFVVSTGNLFEVSFFLCSYNRTTHKKTINLKILNILWIKLALMTDPNLENLTFKQIFSRFFRFGWNFSIQFRHFSPACSM